eukprot:gene15239-6446_t
MDSTKRELAIVDKTDLERALCATKEIRVEANQVYTELRNQVKHVEKLKLAAENWNKLQKQLESEEYFLVSRKDIERLTTEAMQIKEYLPKILRKDFYLAYTKLDKTEAALLQTKAEKQRVASELDRATKKHQNNLAELEGERQEKAEMKQAIEELNEINSQQSDYCSRMGAATCTLLWRLSQREDCTETILAGTHTDEFIQLVCHTIESFSLTLSENESYDENSREVKFVLALCGVATNIAASSYGREFLMSNENGEKLVDSIIFTFCKILPERKQEIKMRNLCMKFLYNTRLIQSLMLESENASLAHVVLSMFSIENMRAIAVDAAGELQEALLELINDVKFLSREQ